MEIFVNLLGFCVAYLTMLTMAWMIASQSLYLNHAKAGKRGETIQQFHDDLKPPAQYIVRHYLAQGQKNKQHKTFRRIATRIFRLLLAFIYLSFVFGFTVQVAIYWQMEQAINSFVMLLIVILSIWHFIAAWQFGQRMMQLQKRKIVD